MRMSCLAGSLQEEEEGSCETSKAASFTFRKLSTLPATHGETRQLFGSGAALGRGKFFPIARPRQFSTNYGKRRAAVSRLLRHHLREDR